MVREPAVAGRFYPGSADRLAAVRELSELRLPVGDPRALEAESVPRPEDLLP